MSGYEPTVVARLLEEFKEASPDFTMRMIGGEEYDANHQIAAYWACKRGCTSPEAAMSLAARAMRSSHPGLRWFAMYDLVHLCSRAGETRPDEGLRQDALTSALHEEDGELVYLARAVRSALGDEAIVQEIAEQLSRGPATGGLVALLARSPLPAAVSLLERLARAGPGSPARLDAALALAEAGVRGYEALLAEGLSSGKSGRQVRTAFALARLGDRRGLDELGRFTGEPDQDVQGALRVGTANVLRIARWGDHDWKEKLRGWIEQRRT